MATPQLNPAPHAAPPVAADSRPPFGSSFLTRNLGLIALVSLLVATWMLVYTFTMFHPKYGAKATVIIKDSAITNRYVEPEQFYSVQTTTSTSSNPVLNTMGLLKSEAISDALWAYFSEKHPEELKRLKIKTQKEWESYYQDGAAFIKAKNQPGTDLITIQFSWAKPQIAKEALSVVVKAFQDASRDLNKEEQISRTRFLSRQMGDIEAKLQDIRKKKSEYESKKATVSVRREGDDLAGSRMELSNRLAQLQGQAQGKENIVRRYRQMLGMSPEAALRGAALGQNGTMVRLQDELYRLQQHYSLLSSSLTDANPKVREVQAQIDQVRANIELEKNRVGAPKGDDQVIADSTRATLISDMLKAQGEAQDLRAQATRIAQRLGQVNADIRNFPSTAVGLTNLEQQENTLSTALDHLRQKVMEGKMKEAQTLSNVFIVDAPRLPEQPSFPNRTHLIVISILLAGAAGVSVAFIKEQLFGRSTEFAPDYPAFANQSPEFEPEAVASEYNENDYTENEYNEPEHNEPDEFEVESQLVQTVTFQEADPLSESVASTATTVAQTATVVQTSTTVKHAPNPDDVLGVNLPVEKVEVPATGSLFDSLLPLAGPMARAIGPTVASAQTVQVASVNPAPDELRRDLTQPLPVTEVTDTLSQPAHAVVSNTPVSNTIQTYQDEDLLPPSINTKSTTEAHLQQVRLASQRLDEAFTPALGVPVMHAAPSATPAYINDPLSVASTVNETANPTSHSVVVEEISEEITSDFSTSAFADEIDEFPSLVLNETPVAEPVEFQHSQFLENEIQSNESQSNPVQDDSATTLYEAQAKAMPLPRHRRMRSVPAFLLDERTVDVQTEEEPLPSYELIPRKRRSQAFAAAQADVASTSQASTQTNRPADQNMQKSSEELFADLSPVQTAPSVNLADTDFPPMPTFVPKEFARHRPKKKLFGGLFPSARTFREPELKLGGHLHPRNR
jgi:uncharacterized protein involved in exopolysaccharide biosynthesis